MTALERRDRNRAHTLLARAVRHAVGMTGRATLWPNRGGVAKHDDGSRTPYGLGLGGADLLGFIHGTGRLFALEIKTGKARPTEAQRTWHAYVNANGGFACIVRSVDEALEALARAEAGDRP